MANKLELTWYGKDEPILVEPRLLIENAALSNTAADPDTENTSSKKESVCMRSSLRTSGRFFSPESERAFSPPQSSTAKRAN